MHSTGAGLLPRLLADAERHAAEGRVREAFVLLRWASRVAPPASLPVVLLAYHRVRAARKEAVGTAVGELAAEAPRLGLTLAAGAGVESDALGFPVPRFPTRAPELDPAAFVPAPRIAESPPTCPPPAATVQPRPLRATTWRTAVFAIAVVVAAVLTLAPEAARKLGARFVGERNVGKVAAEALREGEPARALAFTDGVADPPPAVLLIRARALLALGDTSAGATALFAAAAHPRATGEEAGEAARLLASLPGRQNAAADAYLRAISAGLPPEYWPAAADALDRAGRRTEALRLRDLSDSARSPGRQNPP